MKTINLLSTGLTAVIGNNTDLIRDVRSLRYQVFCVEEGFNQDMVITPLDHVSTHIVLYLDNKPVASVSIVSRNHSKDKISELSVPKELIGEASLATKMVVAQSDRGKSFPVILFALVFKLIVEPQGIRFLLLILDGKHTRNEYIYEKTGTFRRLATGEGPYGKQLLMLFDRNLPKSQILLKRLQALADREFRPS